MHRGPPARRTTPDRRAERRRVPRISGGPPLSVDGVAGCIHDVSRHGFCLVTDADVSPGAVLDLLLRDERDRRTCGVTAEVVWRCGERAGFRFVDWTPEQDAWLQACFVSWLR